RARQSGGWRPTIRPSFCDKRLRLRAISPRVGTSDIGTLVMPPQTPQTQRKRGKEIIGNASFLFALRVCGVCGGHLFCLKVCWSDLGQVFLITIKSFTMIILVFTMRNNRVHDQ